MLCRRSFVCLDEKQKHLAGNIIIAVLFPVSSDRLILDRPILTVIVIIDCPRRPLHRRRLGRAALGTAGMTTGVDIGGEAVVRGAYTMLTGNDI